MKAYNFECPKCKFDGLTIEEKRELVDRKESAKTFRKYDRIVKTTKDGDIIETILCPNCDGMVQQKDGSSKQCPMEVVGGPIGGSDILPDNSKNYMLFVPYTSNSCGRKIHTEAEMRDAYIEMWAPKVATKTPTVEEPKSLGKKKKALTNEAVA